MNNPNKTTEVISTGRSFIMDNWLLTLVLASVGFFVFYINNRFRLFSREIQDAEVDPNFYRLIDFIVKTSTDSLNNTYGVFAIGILLLGLEDALRSQIGQVITQDQAIQMAKRPNFFGGISFFITVLIVVLQMQSFRAILDTLQDFKRRLGIKSTDHHSPKS